MRARTARTAPDVSRRVRALMDLRRRMLDLVPLQPEDDLATRDVSVRRLRAAGQISRMVEEI